MPRRPPFCDLGSVDDWRPKMESEEDDLITTVLSIDRFEGPKKEIAVLLTDDGRTVNLPRWLLPKGAKAGDVLKVSLERDIGATAKVVAETKKVQAELSKRDDGGDLKL